MIRQQLIIIIHHKIKQNMSDFHQVHAQNEIHKLGQSSTSGSPPSLTPMTASEAFAIQKIAKRKDFKFELEIEQEAPNSAQNIQDRKRWNMEQQHLLLQLHGQFGNKWTNIAFQLPGRDHNSVKNHFYAQIRKSLRRINYFIRHNLSQTSKQLNINHISKMITLFSQKCEKTAIKHKNINEIQDLKKYLFLMSKKQECSQLSEEEVSKMKYNIEKINQLLEQSKKYMMANRQMKKGQNNEVDIRRKEEKIVKSMAKIEQKQPNLNNGSVGEYKNKNIQTGGQAFNSNNYMVFYVWNNYLPSPQFQHSYINASAINCTQNFMNVAPQYCCFGSNIFKSS